MRHRLETQSRCRYTQKPSCQKPQKNTKPEGSVFFVYRLKFLFFNFMSNFNHFVTFLANDTFVNIGYAVNRHSPFDNVAVVCRLMRFLKRRTFEFNRRFLSVKFIFKRILVYTLFFTRRFFNNLDHLIE